MTRLRCLKSAMIGVKWILVPPRITLAHNSTIFYTERCLDKDEKPADLMKEWESDKKSKVPPCFLFKKKIFLKDDEREMQDPVAKDLVYIQAVREKGFLCF
jgi:hypothetical protein